MFGNLRRLVADEGDNHAVKVEEEHEKMEAELDKRLLQRGLASFTWAPLAKEERIMVVETDLLVDVELTEDLGGIEEVVLLEDPADRVVSYRGCAP